MHIDSPHLPPSPGAPVENAPARLNARRIKHSERSNRIEQVEHVNQGEQGKENSEPYPFVIQPARQEEIKTGHYSENEHPQRHQPMMSARIVEDQLVLSHVVTSSNRRTQARRGLLAPDFTPSARQRRALGPKDPARL